MDGFKPIHKSSGICDREYHALNGASRKIKKNIFPKTASEVEKLFENILPYITNIGKNT